MLGAIQEIYQIVQYIGLTNRNTQSYGDFFNMPNRLFTRAYLMIFGIWRCPPLTFSKVCNNSLSIAGRRMQTYMQVDMSTLYVYL